MTFETPDQTFQRFDFPGLLWSQADDLFEPRVHRAHVFLCVKQHDSFFQPFDYVLQLGFGLICWAR